MTAPHPDSLASAPAATDATPGAVPRAEDEVVRICRELLRLDPSYFGAGSGPGEGAAAEYVMGLLHEVGLEPELFESEPGRASVVVRLEGADPVCDAHLTLPTTERVLLSVVAVSLK